MLLLLYKHELCAYLYGYILYPFTFRCPCVVRDHHRLIQRLKEEEGEEEDAGAVDRWQLDVEDEEGDEEEGNESHNHGDKDARQIHQMILKGLKVSKGREEKLQRFVQLIWLAQNEQAMNFPFLPNIMHRAKPQSQHSLLHTNEVISCQ